VPVVKEFKFETLILIDNILNGFSLTLSGVYVFFIIWLIFKDLDKEKNRVCVKKLCVLITILATLINVFFYF
jgi:hypothetical protein